MRMILLAGAALALGLSGCESAGMDEEGVSGGAAQSMDDAGVTLVDARGRTVANAELTRETGGVRVRLAATAMPAGTYGAHVHMVGRCDAPSFESAGAHWNPTGARHGRDNPAGAHLGDLPNLSVGADGRGSVEYTIAGAAIEGPSRAMLDADGAALLIHAQADDYRTDPSGNSGARIACGLIR